MSKNSSDYDANLALYLQEIAKIPLLTPEDEKTSGQDNSDQ